MNPNELQIIVVVALVGFLANSIYSRLGYTKHAAFAKALILIIVLSILLSPISEEFRRYKRNARTIKIEYPTVLN